MCTYMYVAAGVRHLAVSYLLRPVTVVVMMRGVISQAGSDLAEADRSLDMERDDHAITKGKYSSSDSCCLVEVVEDLQLPQPDKHESELLSSNPKPALCYSLVISNNLFSIPLTKQV